MEARYTIGQLARAAGVPTSTVRFYERRRLLRPDGRTEGNYRTYGAASFERLRFIRAAQANGFALEDIAALLSLRDGTTAPCKEVQTLVEQRLGDLEKRVKQLSHLRSVLRSSLKLCRRAERSGRCQVIDRLKVASSSPRPTNARGPASR